MAARKNSKKTQQTQMALEMVASPAHTPIDEVGLEEMLATLNMGGEPGELLAGDDEAVFDDLALSGGVDEVVLLADPQPNDDADLEAALAGLNDEQPQAEPETVIEAAGEVDLDAALAGIEQEVQAEAAGEVDLEAAIGDLEREEVMQEHYAKQEAVTDTVEVAEKPATQEWEDEDYLLAGVPMKGKKATGTKKATTPRQYFAKKSERIEARLGDKQADYMLLEMNDALLDEAGIQAKIAETKAAVDGCAKKVGEKAAMLFDWMMKGGELNEVMKRTFTLLLTEGMLTSGDEGNLHKNLLAKPYSMGTARSQGNQMFVLLPLLKITNKVKGKVTTLTPNDDSLILAKVKAVLGL